MSSKWFALDVSIEPIAREAVEYALMESGALGTETSGTTPNFDSQTTQVTAYFDGLPEREQVRAELLDALRIYCLPSSAVRNMELRDVPDQDWLTEWKKNWQPVTAGGCFIIAPPWATVAEPDRIVIRIEPGMAFGTGSHETTRLCLAAIEKHFNGGSFLDVGTGTGILAIAAAKLGPNSRVEACDVDDAAIAIAQTNARLNEVENQIRFRVGSIDDSTASADVVCANLTADVICDLLPALSAVTCCRLILSGILASQAETVLSRLSQIGTKPIDVSSDGEWVAIVV